MKIDLPTNLDEVEVSEGFEPLPVGEYKLEIVKEPEFREGNKSNYLRWEMEVVDHPEHEGRKVWHNTFLSKKALEAGMPNGLKALLEAIGVQWESDQFDTALCVGQRYLAEVGQRTNDSDPDDDRIFNEVEKIYPAYE